MSSRNELVSVLFSIFLNVCKISSIYSLNILQNLRVKSSGLRVFFMEVFNYKFKLFHRFRAILIFLFLLMPLYVICVFHKMCPLSLSCQLDWHKAVHNIPHYPFNV